MSVAGLLLLVALLGVGLHAFVAADRRYQEALQEAMNGVITRGGRDTLDEVERLVRENKQVLRPYHANARRFRAEERHEEAARRMALGCVAIEALAPDFKSALAALFCLTRSVSLMVEVPPVRARSFRTRSLFGLAGLARVVHEFLLTGRQKMLLRLTVVSAAFRLALRWLRRATHRTQERPSSLSAWRQIDALVSDLETVGDETVITARQVVQAVDAVELGQPVSRPGRWRSLRP